MLWCRLLSLHEVIALWRGTGSSIYRSSVLIGLALVAARIGSILRCAKQTNATSAAFKTRAFPEHNGITRRRTC